ncbi:small nuclear ribonucleoprotein [Virgibacillus byunsanensis]|uniref:Small nuclear ribonucleoprotein n=1 Tax=Virgibacillus byunsanensis TaxID=570945 RepID=A0ABW3LPY2_9BACI
MTQENFTRNLEDDCRRYMYHHVVLTFSDGSSVDGIIEDVDGNRVTVLVGEDVMEREDNELDDRQFYGYGRPRRRFRRFRRQFLPLAALTALSLLPYAPYPYYYPPYYPYPYY